MVLVAAAPPVSLLPPWPTLAPATLRLLKPLFHLGVTISEYITTSNYIASSNYITSSDIRDYILSKRNLVL